MKIACAQINPVIADIAANTAKIIEYIEKARNHGVDLVVFPEMSILGYPPMDLLENDKLVQDNLRALDTIRNASRDIAVICGYVDTHTESMPVLYNSAAFINNGKIESCQHKTLLPSYDVFDEVRYFYPSHEHSVINFKGRKLGITICEDIWSLADGVFIEDRKYKQDPVQILSSKGVDCLINISASPFIMGKTSSKKNMLTALARKYELEIIYVNQVGGNDSLIFDGNSMVINKEGDLIGHGGEFVEDLCIVDLEDAKVASWRIEELEEVRKALVLGIRDYVHKCGFSNVVLGLSGGIDSAVTCALAVEALGSDKVFGITMPSMYSSSGSVNDSVKLAESLNIKIEKITINSLYDQFIKDLDTVFHDRAEDTTEENLQARIRGTLLMAVSNKFGSLLLTTGNKSELAMGYCTLYGDMNGGLAVIADLPKTLVYKLAGHINREREIIPENTITKPPSAELRENQTDQDSLPDYETLDCILKLYIEERASKEYILAQGFDAETVDFVLRMVNINEYKRRQAAPALKVTSKAFGIGRRIPIAEKYVP